MPHWLSASLVALVVFGLWGFFPKLAVQYMAPRSALFWEAIGVLIVGTGIFVSLHGRPETNPRGILFALLTGVAGITGTLFFFYAARQGKISVVVSITALYPIITILLAWLLLGENITARQFCGMFAALLAIYLLSA